MDKVIDYKCPCCGAAIAFDPRAQELKCASCGNTYSVELMSELCDEANSDGKTTSDWGTYKCDDRASGTVTYSCRFCGAEIECDVNTVATECVYCGNPIVISDTVSGISSPDVILPFKLDRESAKTALINYYNGKKLLPDEFKSENNIERIRGVYVPYWLYNCHSHANATYDATRVHSWHDSRYNYVRTDHFLVSRTGGADFADIPVDASSKMPDNYMDALEPFDFSGAVPFRDGYMAGYVADRYDVDSLSGSSRAELRIENTMNSLLRDTVHGYVSVVKRRGSVQNSNGTVRYAFLPVWILNTRYKDKTYLFAMNGQTGKMVGELPVDKGKAAKFFAIAAAVSMAVINVIALLALLVR